MTYAITPQGRVRTSAGVEIGRSYIAPPARMGSEAECIQSGLLRKQARRSRSHYVLAWAGAMRPRRGLPTLTPTTRWGRLLAWLRGLA